MPDKVINNYEIISHMSEGGMGAIYYGKHLTLNRPVAIKQLHLEFTNNIDFKNRFINEAVILAKLSHPNIISVYDLIEDNGNFFIVMEYIKGETIEDSLKRMSSPFQTDRALYIFTQILSAFDYAHAQGIIHRDIKPSNIILNENDIPKVLDFGIAKILQKDFNMTKAGTKMGSLLYMSPEQVMGRDVDLRSDIYSLGILLYEMLTASLPHNANSEYEIMDSILKQPIPDINRMINGLPGNLGRIIMKACEKNPGDRFQSAGLFMDAIDNIGQRGTVNSSDSKLENHDFNKTIYQSSYNNNYQNRANTLTEKKSPKNIIILLAVIMVVIAVLIISFIIFNKEGDKIVSTLQMEKTKTNSYANINLNGKYKGTIKDGTAWEVEIFGFDGQNFNGNNIIYWSFVKSPAGLTSTFNGKLNKVDGTIEMYEDPNGKKTGKFIGIISQDGINITGNWYRYTDNGSYSWNLTKY